LIARLQQAGIRCVPTVGAVKHALKMAELGVDMLVVQGGEGGGHTGSVAGTVLLPQVLDAVQLPVVAAGGFADGRGLVAALAYGAHGIAMGTRFLLTTESPVPLRTKQCYLAASTEDILVTDRLDGVPQRMIRNRYAARLEHAGRLRHSALEKADTRELGRIDPVRASDAACRQFNFDTDHDGGLRPGIDSTRGTGGCPRGRNHGHGPGGRPPG
jgi:NAD(P)H-dependent flavin oxidoreductase YrpB (nitropropane dioxygenase family)